MIILNYKIYTGTANMDRYDSLHNKLVFAVADLNQAMRLLVEKRVDIEMNDAYEGTHELKSAFRYLQIQRDVLKTVLYE